MTSGTWQDLARFDKGAMARFGKIDKGGPGKIWQDLARHDKGDMARFGKI